MVIDVVTDLLFEAAAIDIQNTSAENFSFVWNQRKTPRETAAFWSLASCRFLARNQMRETISCAFGQSAAPMATFTRSARMKGATAAVKAVRGSVIAASQDQPPR